ncbi:MAG: Rap1a/Tai family immunity protein [Candidatus Rokuibacteriota bacterium]
MARRMTHAGLLLVIATLAFTAPAPAVTPAEFGLRSGADVVALCATPARDPLYTAAVHMCHGFGAGTYQTIMAMTRHEKLKAIICPPDPSPSRNETVRRFLQWANDNPRYLAEPAVEVFARFFITQFPCGSK